MFFIQGNYIHHFQDLASFVGSFVDIFVALESISVYIAKDSKTSMVSSLTGKYNKMP